VLGAFVVVTFVSLDLRLTRRLREDRTAELLREARLVGAQWHDGASPDSLADVAGRALAHRVTLIATDGTVTGDSEFDEPALGRLENHASRPEVMQARATGEGWSLRTSPSAGDEELYAAVRVPHGVARVSLSTRSQAVLVARMQRDLLIVGAGGTLLVLVLATLFARSLSRPILELRDDARAIAAGDLSRRPSLAAPGEVGELASAFHRLAEQLSARLTALEADDALFRALTESLNEGTVALDSAGQVVHLNERARRLLGVTGDPPFPADLLPRDRVFRDAIDAAVAGEPSDALELTIQDRIVALTARPLATGGAVVALFDLTPLRRLETVRRDFVANVSHELKTPLTVVGGFAETLADDSLTPEQRRQFAWTILTNTKRMQRLVDDLLDLSRIESGGWTPNPVEIDFELAARDAIGPLQHKAETRGLALRIETEPPRVTLRADPTALRQVLVNLADNALRHTPAGEVVVFARDDAGGVTFGVRDTGTGMRAEHLERIFERFYRVDASRARDDGGTGLGLAIVKHLIEAHGGRVRATSAPDRGTTVEAWLPRSPRAQPAEDAVPK
jgi:signal transduction histidine kinase